jgi:nitronate monooxygenase
VVVEGPLAGGHLGFGMDWAQYDLATIVAEIREWMKAEQLDIPLIPAGGIFTGSTRCLPGNGRRRRAGGDPLHRAEGMRPARRRQAGVLQGHEDDIEVNGISPTGYPMRMLKNSPGHRRRHPPQLRGLRLPARRQRQLRSTSTPTTAKWRPSRGQEGQGHGQDLPVHPHAQLRYVDLRPLHLPAEGHHARNEDGSYALLSAEHIFRDYQFSTDGKIALPAAPRSRLTAPIRPEKPRSTGSGRRGRRRC